MTETGQCLDDRMESRNYFQRDCIEQQPWNCNPKLCFTGGTNFNYTLYGLLPISESNPFHQIFPNVSIIC